MYAGKVGKRFAILSLQPFLVFGLGRIFDVFIGAVMWIWQIMEAVKDVKEYNQNLGEDEESEDVVWVCESCGKQFDSKKECSDHEKECGCLLYTSPSPRDS